MNVEFVFFVVNEDMKNFDLMFYGVLIFVGNCFYFCEDFFEGWIFRLCMLFKIVVFFYLFLL